MREADVGDLCVVKIKPLQVRKARQMHEAGVGDLRVVEDKYLQAREAHHVREVSIGDLRTRKMEPRCIPLSCRLYQLSRTGHRDTTTSPTHVEA